jgi:hypothetical protein
VKTTFGRLGEARDLGRVTARFAALADLEVDLAIVDLPAADDPGCSTFSLGSSRSWRRSAAPCQPC